jgi:hypothetical protein
MRHRKERRTRNQISRLVGAIPAGEHFLEIDRKPICDTSRSESTILTTRYVPILLGYASVHVCMTGSFPEKGKPQVENVELNRYTHEDVLNEEGKIVRIHDSEVELSGDYNSLQLPELEKIRAELRAIVTLPRKADDEPILSSTLDSGVPRY